MSVCVSVCLSGISLVTEVIFIKDTVTGFFFYNNFAFGEYVPVYSVVLKVWSVKYSPITKFCLQFTLQSHNKSMLWVFRIIRATRKPMLMVFRATRKQMLWYSEQQVNTCYGIQSNKEINAKGNSSNKEIHDLVSGTNILENWDLSIIFQQK